MRFLKKKKIERIEQHPPDLRPPDLINPKEAVGYVTSNKVVLDDQTIQRIKYQVEQRVRTVEPYKLL
jgi:hypothetical protein